MKCIVATSVCMSVCLSVPRRIPTLLHRPGCNLGEWYGCPLVVHNWANLQSVHGFRRYNNIHVCKLIALYIANAYSAKRELSVSACTRAMAGLALLERLERNKCSLQIASGSFNTNIDYTMPTVTNFTITPKFHKYNKTST